MGEIIQGPWGDRAQSSYQASSHVDVNTLLLQLQTFTANAPTLFEQAKNVTKCFERFDVWPDQCQRVQAVLQGLLNAVEGLLQLVKNSDYASACYSLTIQGNHVLDVLEELHDGVGSVASSRGNASLYEAAWSDAYQKIQGYPSQVEELVTRASACYTEIVRNALS